MGWLDCLCGLWRRDDPETAPLFPPPTTVLTAPPRAHPRPIATLFSLFPSSPRAPQEPPTTELSTTATAPPLLAYTFPSATLRDSTHEAKHEADERRGTISRAYGSRMCLIGAPSPPATPTVLELPREEGPHPWFHAAPTSHRRNRSLELPAQLAMSVAEHGLPGTLAPIVAAAKARRGSYEDVVGIVITPETPLTPRRRPPPLPLRPHASTVGLCDSPTESAASGTPTPSLADSGSMRRGRAAKRHSSGDDALGVVYKDLGLKGLPSPLGARQPRRATSKSRLRKRARADTVS
ncbi:hypothetical protein Q8F55_002907 [Vanrija albida]|uniref:Uncharacterized protein n=1 Tax=Vanrija albida TaxID=181172 RepID=A0ABR3QB48_9TREE